MKILSRLAVLFVLMVALLFSVLSVLAASAKMETPSLHTAAEAGEATIGGFVDVGTQINRSGSQANSPMLALNGMQNGLWAATVQSNTVIVSKFDAASDQWLQQGSAVSGAGGKLPTIGLGGNDHNTPWLAWIEPQNSTQQLMTAWFDGANWHSTAPLNRDPTKAATEPALATGKWAGESATLPWVAWSEENASGHNLLVASRALADGNAVGGFGWQAIGDALNFGAGSDAQQPAMTFVDTSAWIVWQEASGNGNNHIFASHAISDAGAIGGVAWERVGSEEACGTNESACALNQDAGQDASQAKIASGQLSNESSTTPWIVFAEAAADGQRDIHVLRLDQGDTPNDASDDRFIPVGTSVNRQCLADSGLSGQGGSEPDIVFVGNVPHVAWIETVDGHAQLYVCHLADVRFGQERWDLDSYFPINHDDFAAASHPSLASDGSTPYLAWQEGTTTTNLYAARRSPATPAWGSNRPPFIRTISWSRDYLGYAIAANSIQLTPDQPTAQTRPLTLTTSCDHVGGWEHIREIQYKIANPTLTAFFGRYVAAENKVYVEDPTHPGTFLGAIEPGTGGPVETTIVTLYTADMQIRSHGPGSPALDIDWIISFKEPTMDQDFKQMINIIYDDQQETGFFETGELSFDYRAYLPLLTR